MRKTLVIFGVLLVLAAPSGTSGSVACVGAAPGPSATGIPQIQVEGILTTKTGTCITGGSELTYYGTSCQGEGQDVARSGVMCGLLEVQVTQVPVCYWQLATGSARPFQIALYVGYDTNGDGYVNSPETLTGPIPEAQFAQVPNGSGQTGRLIAYPANDEYGTSSAGITDTSVRTIIGCSLL